MDAISTSDLTFCYHGKEILKKICLHVPQGSVYGYIGKNGAGKTTTIQLLLGLLQAPKGTVFFKNIDFKYHRIQILQQVGALIEQPVLYGHLTCYEQLKYADRFFHQGEQRIHEVLQMIDLQEEQHTKIKKLSMGMKQRLGIGMAIFHRPDLLVLDEPINNLDPFGVKDVRQWIEQWHKEGKTVFLSSHILVEMEKTCTHIGILEDGKLLYQGRIDDLLQETGCADLEGAYMHIIGKYHGKN